MKQNLAELREDTDSSPVAAAAVNAPLSGKDRTTEQRVTRETEGLSTCINQADLVGTREHHAGAEHTGHSLGLPVFWATGQASAHGWGWHHKKCVLQSPRNKARNQQVGETWEIHKYVEIK